MSTEMLQRAVLGENPTRQEAADLLRAFAEGNLGPEILAAALTALRIRGESASVLLGFLDVLRERLLPVDLGELQAIDLCGTGGDGQGTLNLSTAAAFIAAGAGVVVAKHGNHGVSSRTGSADVLGALGLPPQRNVSVPARMVRELGLGFLYAPAHHPLFARLGPVRRALGFRTAFNLLGPLCNPAGVKRQVIGVPSVEALELLAAVLCELRPERVLLVHTPGPYDEVSLTAPAQVRLVEDSHCQRFQLAPEDFGAQRLDPEVLKGGDAATNATRLEALLDGRDAALDAACANAACGLFVAGLAPDFPTAFQEAHRAVLEGRASGMLAACRRFMEGRDELAG